MLVLVETWVGEIHTGSGSDAVLAAAKKVWLEVCSRFTTYGYLGSIPPSQSKRQIDCSGYVTWVLYELGYSEFDNQVDTNKLYNTNWNAKYGWTEIPVGSGENPRDILQPGDIFVRYEGKGSGQTHHVLIVERIEGKELYAYDCGSAKSFVGSNGESVRKTYFLTKKGPGKIIRISNYKGGELGPDLDSEDVVQDNIPRKYNTRNTEVALPGGETDYENTNQGTR